MTKVVYNAQFGGFSVSDAGIKRYAEIKGIKLYPEKGYYGLTTYWTVPRKDRVGILDGDAFYQASLEARQESNHLYAEYTIDKRDFSRTDPVLAQVVEELGTRASGAHASLRVAEVPSGTRYRIDKYDGNESIMMVDDYAWDVA